MQKQKSNVCCPVQFYWISLSLFSNTLSRIVEMVLSSFTKYSNSNNFINFVNSSNTTKFNHNNTWYGKISSCYENTLCPIWYYSSTCYTKKPDQRFNASCFDKWSRSSIEHCCLLPMTWSKFAFKALFFSGKWLQFAVFKIDKIASKNLNQEKQGRSKNEEI